MARNTSRICVSAFGISRGALDSPIVVNRTMTPSMAAWSAPDAASARPGARGGATCSSNSCLSPPEASVPRSSRIARTASWWDTNRPSKAVIRPWWTSARISRGDTPAARAISATLKTSGMETATFNILDPGSDPVRWGMGSDPGNPRGRCRRGQEPCRQFAERADCSGPFFGRSSPDLLGGTPTGCAPPVTIDVDSGQPAAPRPLPAIRSPLSACVGRGGK